MREFLAIAATFWLLAAAVEGATLPPDLVLTISADGRHSFAPADGLDCFDSKWGQPTDCREAFRSPRPCNRSNPCRETARLVPVLWATLLPPPSVPPSTLTPRPVPPGVPITGTPPFCCGGGGTTVPPVAPPPPVVPVPVPAAGWLLLAGLGLIVAMRRKWKWT